MVLIDIDSMSIFVGSALKFQTRNSRVAMCHCLLVACTDGAVPSWPRIQRAENGIGATVQTDQIGLAR